MDDSEQVESAMKIVDLIVECLTPDLLKPPFRESPRAIGNPTYGHCYVATEALFHLLKQPHQWRPQVGTDGHGNRHWWLQHSVDGTILDPTYQQYRVLQEPLPYEASGGHPQTFLTKGPSKRAKILMERVRKKMKPEASRALFMHFNKPSSKAAGHARWSVHFQGKCHIVDHVVFHDMTISTRRRKAQPIGVLVGRCKPSDFFIENDTAYIGPRLKL